MKGIYLRGTTYWMRFTVNGTRVFESAETSDRKTAELILKKRQLEIHEGKYFGKIKEVRISLKEAIQEYLTLTKEHKSSWTDDKAMLERFSEFLGIQTHLQDIDRLAIEKFRTHLLADGLSKARVNRYLANIKAFFNRMIEWGKTKTNPVRGFKFFHEDMRNRYLEVGQIQFLLDECSERLRPIVKVALLTGLRKGDILDLKWNQIDIENRKLWIQQKKTEKPLIVHMSETLVDVLRAVEAHSDCPYVFHENGKHLGRFGWVRTDFMKAVKASGLTDFRFHDLRHTFATQQRFLGRDIALIKELMGHRSIRMTMRYSHVNPLELKEANDTLGEKILKKETKKIQSSFPADDLTTGFSIKKVENQ